MSLLKVSFLPDMRCGSPVLNLIGSFLKEEGHKLTFEPWPAATLKPEVVFNLAYGDDAIFLKFNVKEKHFKAIYRQTNDPVWKDSCVEFFIGFDEDDTYYNFEFNAIGTVLVGYGSAKKRELLPASLVEEIDIIPARKTVPGDLLPFEWELRVAIPFKLFYKHNISTLKGISAKANFYKCGDDLPEPHFLCWSNIIADRPDFHLPQYFGTLVF